jgi:7,8-dihydroneopterin aldolase/epimerase/oxygenase
MDRVAIDELKVEATIGVYEWERRIRQQLIFDLELATDAARAAKSDRIEDALDYKQVAKRVRAFVARSEFRLVESLAQAVAEMLGEEFGARWVRVALRKPGAVTGAASVGVIVERGNAD